MVYEEKPADFTPDMEVVGCLVECQGKIVLLLRQDHKREGNKWDLPAGKVDKKDLGIKEAMCRELSEETGIQVDKKELNFYKTFYVSHLGFNFFYHYFNLKLNEFPDIVISKDEHKEFVWVTPSEALKMPLVLDEDYCMGNYYGIK
ncbi:MAG TPA: NUDIX hydrolase [Candidatus Paceibacterota bacterium]|nr:NUDIX hydrolase [Candidatus Paceibacterota bacterium]